MQQKKLHKDLICVPASHSQNISTICESLRRKCSAGMVYIDTHLSTQKTSLEAMHFVDTQYPGGSHKDQMNETVVESCHHNESWNVFPPELMTC